MRQEVRWTDLTYEQIADHLAEAGTPVSVPVVKQLLRKHGYVTRKAQKSKAMGEHPDRNQQFENIARLKQEYLESDNPIVSMDTKKKELIGNFYRAGHLLTQGSSRRLTTTFPAPLRV
jgi:alkylated DNA repair dioxygenase AlkB